MMNIEEQIRAALAEGKTKCAALQEVAIANPDDKEKFIEGAVAAGLNEGTARTQFGRALRNAGKEVPKVQKPKPQSRGTRSVEEPKDPRAASKVQVMVYIDKHSKEEDLADLAEYILNASSDRNAILERLEKFREEEEDSGE